MCPFFPTTFVPKATFCWKTAQIKHKGNRKLIYEIYIREIWRFIPCKVMNYLKIYARNTSSIASIRPFGLVYIVFNWDCPLWRPLAHINDTNLYMNFENSGCTCPLGGALPTAVWIPVYHICKAVLKLNMLSPFASFCLSVTKIPQPLRIKPICHYAYLLIIFDISDLSDL